MPQVGGDAEDHGQANVRLLHHLWLTVTPNVPAHMLSVSAELLFMIVSYAQGNPLIRALPKPLHVNATASFRLPQI